jgi:hypothetical protein
MQLNLNTAIRQSNPNFKADFASDKKTRKILEEMIEKDPVTITALKIALKDSKNPSKIKCFVYEPKEEYIPKLYGIKNPSVEDFRLATSDLKELLKYVCYNVKNGLGFDIKSVSHENYISKAKEVLKFNNSHLKNKLIEMAKNYVLK